VGVVVGDVSEAGSVLVVNVGSSSVKLRLLGASDELLSERDLGAPSSGSGELEKALAAFAGVPAVGHRIVHGGTRFTAPVVVDDEVRAALAELVELAPLHQPPALVALDCARAALPAARHVACFDTAFHATLPAAASTYAVPREWRERLGVRRYGFHGLSHAYAARRAASLLEAELGELRLVTCHLGAGASLCAIRDGRSVDTTMGFTPLEGLVMATRSGSLDPGLVLWLIRSAGVDPSELEDALERRSGLLGLSGTADMRELLGRVAQGDAVAGLALDVYRHRLRASIAAMSASLGRVDAVVFTGGVGERSPEVRSAAVDGIGFLGAELDRERNARAIGDLDLDVSEASARCRTLVVRAREDLEIAAQVRRAATTRVA
jgi:acetate kinase